MDRTSELGNISAGLQEVLNGIKISFRKSKKFILDLLYVAVIQVHEAVIPRIVLAKTNSVHFYQAFPHV